MNTIRARAPVGRRPKGPSAWALLAIVLLLPGCGDAAPEGIVRLEVRPGNTLVVGVGETVSFSVVAVGPMGDTRTPTGVVWSSTDPGVATVTGSGLANSVGAGTTSITAQVDGFTGSATLEVWVAPDVVAYDPGTSYFGRRSYVEYVPGTLPLVISAPHGGALTPGEIPDRTWGTLVTDSNTEETIRAVRNAFIERTGHAPHIVVSHLRRTKLDPNREIGEAAQESPFAELAWAEFHRFIEVAEATVIESRGSGLYLDLHGHGHDKRRLELGYLLSSADLNGSDAQLDDQSLATKSSLRALAQSTGLPFSELVRGRVSFGAHLGQQGVPSVPSLDDPAPGSDPYFTGGYNTARHGSREAGKVVSGIQLELHRPGIRDTDENRRAFALRLAWATEMFMLEHFGFFRP